MDFNNTLKLLEKHEGEIFTGEWEWKQEMSSIAGKGNVKFKSIGSTIIAVDKNSNKEIGVWDEHKGEGYVK